MDKELAESWAIDEVIIRWYQLHKGTLLTHQYLNPEQRQTMSQSELLAVEETVAVYRQRLYTSVA